MGEYVCTKVIRTSNARRRQGLGKRRQADDRRPIYGGFERSIGDRGGRGRGIGEDERQALGDSGGGRNNRGRDQNIQESITFERRYY